MAVSHKTENEELPVVLTTKSALKCLYKMNIYKVHDYEAYTLGTRQDVLTWFQVHALY